VNGAIILRMVFTTPQRALISLKRDLRKSVGKSGRPIVLFSLTALMIGC